MLNTSAAFLVFIVHSLSLTLKVDQALTIVAQISCSLPPVAAYYTSQLCGLFNVMLLRCEYKNFK